MLYFTNSQHLLVLFAYIVLNLSYLFLDCFNQISIFFFFSDKDIIVIMIFEFIKSAHLLLFMQIQHSRFTNIVKQFIFNGRITNAIQFLKSSIQSNHQPAGQFIGLGSLEDQQGFYKSYAIEWLKQQAQRRQISDYDYLCFCFTVSQSYKQAEEWYIKMTERHSHAYQLIYGLATVYGNTGRYTKAMEHYHKIINMGIHFHKVYQQIAFIAYFHQHQLKTAQLYVKEGLILNKDNLFLRFLKILVTEDVQNKNELLNSLYIQNPGYIRILNNIGKKLIKQQQYESAIQCLQQCIKKDPSYSTPYFNLSIIYQKQNQIDKSILSLQRCCELDTTFRYGQVMIGRLYHEHLKQYQQAEKYLRQALLHQKSQLAASFQLGKMNNYLKKFEQAVFWFQQCIKINPKIAYFYRSLGIVFENKRQFDKAIEYYKKSIELNPKCQISLIGLADSYYYFQRHELAYKYYSEAMQQFTSSAFPEKSFLNCVNILIQQGKLSDTITLLKQAIKIYPHRLIFYTTIGHIYRKAQDYKQAYCHFQHARQKYFANRQKYDGNNLEEEAIRQINNYCGVGENWTKKNMLGIMNIKNQITIKQYISKYQCLLQKMFEKINQQSLNLD